MANSSKWNSWLFTTAKSWSSGQLELPVLDLQEANYINNSIMESLFELKNVFSNVLKNISPENSKNLIITFKTTQLFISSLLQKKIDLIEEININKKFQYDQIKLEIENSLGHTLQLYKSGQLNKSLNTCSEILVKYLEFVEHNDFKNFSINEFIKLIDFTNEESFKKYVSFNTFPTIRLKQNRLIKSISHFEVYYTRRNDDFFTLEELFNEFVNAYKNLTREEKSISEKFDFNYSVKKTNKTSTIEKRIKGLKDKLKYRTKIEKNELIHLYHNLIYHINQTTYAQISTKNITTDYFSGLKDYKQISELFLLTPAIKTIAKDSLEHLLLSFKSTPATAVKELELVISNIGKMESASLILPEENKEQMETSSNESTNQLKITLKNYLVFIKETGELKGSEYKDYLLKLFSMFLMEVSNEE